MLRVKRRRSCGEPWSFTFWRDMSHNIICFLWKILISICILMPLGCKYISYELSYLRLKTKKKLRGVQSLEQLPVAVTDSWGGWAILGPLARVHARAPNIFCCIPSAWDLNDITWTQTWAMIYEAVRCPKYIPHQPSRPYQQDPKEYKCFLYTYQNLIKSF